MGDPAESLWWQWTAPQIGRVNVDTVSSSSDTVLAVYRGTSLSGLTSLACNDEAGGTHSRAAAFFAVAGTTRTGPYRVLAGTDDGFAPGP